MFDQLAVLWLAVGAMHTIPTPSVAHSLQVDQEHRTKHLLEKFEFSLAPYQAWSSLVLVCVVVVGGQAHVSSCLGA
jgi:hypothetical protein